jgi:Na+/H+-dicarboxylate symporter
MIERRRGKPGRTVRILNYSTEKMVAKVRVRHCAQFLEYLCLLQIGLLFFLFLFLPFLLSSFNSII